MKKIPIEQRLASPPGVPTLYAYALEAVLSKTMSEWLSEKRYKPQHSQLSYRVLNDWTEKKLVHDTRSDDSQGWRSFSITDLLWIKLLMALRAFGLSHDALKNVKRSLNLEKKSAYPIIGIAIMMCLKRYPMFIVVFDDGHAELATANCLAFSDEAMGPQNYIRININRLFREIIGDKAGKYAPKYEAKVVLNGEEINVLKALREQGIDEVTIRKQRDKISMIDSTKHVDGAASIIDHVKDIGFGDIDIRVEGGKQRHTKITKRQKLD